MLLMLLSVLTSRDELIWVDISSQIPKDHAPSHQIISSPSRVPMVKRWKCRCDVLRGCCSHGDRSVWGLAHFCFVSLSPSMSMSPGMDAASHNRPNMTKHDQTLRPFWLARSWQMEQVSEKERSVEILDQLEFVCSWQA